MSKALHETRKSLDDARARHEACLVSFSGGKDSLAVLDLCSRTFERVECFFMYFVPGLECVERQLEYARKRWGVIIRQYPHWVLADVIHNGTFGKDWVGYEDVPIIELSDIHAMAREESGIALIATGAKKTDSLWRRRMLQAQGKAGETLIYPVVEWKKLDVLAYLSAHKIPKPDSSGRNATGIDLSAPSLLWLHDTYPDDFKRLCELFPFAEAVVWRRTFHAVA
ncbi:MAG: phosphoadenosine phosphosulfate reductase family protein [Polyangiaceae bacterium]|nr:phosphoadenosine phosphosulfate reductase family protein [Polyangiaceae bacterium]